MRLGILSTKTNEYEYHLEIGLGKALCKKGHQVVIVKGVFDKEEVVVLEDGNLTVHSIPMQEMESFSLTQSCLFDFPLHGMICITDNRAFLSKVITFCQKHTIPLIPYIEDANIFMHKTRKEKLLHYQFFHKTLTYLKTHPVMVQKLKTCELLENLRASEVFYCPIGLDSDNLYHNFRDANHTALRKKYGFSTDSILLCSVSPFHKGSRLIELIDLFHSIQNKKKFEMVIVGEGELEKDIRKRIYNFGLESIIKIIPYVSHKDMWEIYTMSDYYVNLSKENALRTPCMEAVYYKASVVSMASNGAYRTLQGMKGHKLCRNEKDAANWLTGTYPPDSYLEESSMKIMNQCSWDSCADLFLQLIQDNISPKH